MFRSDQSPKVRVAAKQFLSILAKTTDKARLAIASHLNLTEFVKQVVEANNLEQRQKTGYLFIDKSLEYPFAEGVSDDLLLCRLFASCTSN